MCPNDNCAKYGQETALMGGCECGTALVPYAPPEPTDDQLESLMVAMGFPAVVWLRGRHPNWREAALNFHKLVVRGLNGDEEAMQQVARLKAMLGSPTR